MRLKSLCRLRRSPLLPVLPSSTTRLLFSNLPAGRVSSTLLSFVRSRFARPRGLAIHQSGAVSRFETAQVRRLGNRAKILRGSSSLLATGIRRGFARRYDIAVADNASRECVMRKQGSCLEKEIMQGTVPGARRRGRPRTAWMDNIKTWTGLSVEESVRMTEDRHK